MLRKTAYPIVGVGIAVILLAARATKKRFNLRGKVVLLTGGTRGLGFALARDFLSRGCRLAICGRSESTLSAAIAALRRHGEVIGVPADVRRRDEVERFVEKAFERYGRIDVIVHNAGTIAVGPLETMTLDDYRDSMDTHFWGALYLTLAALPALRKTRGRIVNIASIGGILSPPHLLPYNASKFALVGLSEGLHAELADDGIAVTTVCPGLMRTGSPPHAWFKGRNRSEYAWFNLSATSPLSSMSARKAARAIVNACARGMPFVVLSPQARFGAFVHNMFPGATDRLMGKVARLLPKPGGVGQERRAGHQSESPLSRSWLTWLGRKAGRDLNQMLEKF